MCKCMKQKTKLMRQKSRYYPDVGCSSVSGWLSTSATPHHIHKNQITNKLLTTFKVSKHIGAEYRQSGLNLCLIWWQYAVTSSSCCCIRKVHVTQIQNCYVPGVFSSSSGIYFRPSSAPGPLWGAYGAFQDHDRQLPTL